jgi:hypothetical protein
MQLIREHQFWMEVGLDAFSAEQDAERQVRNANKPPKKGQEPGSQPPQVPNPRVR